MAHYVLNAVLPVEPFDVTRATRLVVPAREVRAGDRLVRTNDALPVQIVTSSRIGPSGIWLISTWDEGSQHPVTVWSKQFPAEADIEIDRIAS